MKIGTSERIEIETSAGRADPRDFCASCGLPTGGIAIDGLCGGCYDQARPNVPRPDPRYRCDGPFR